MTPGLNKLRPYQLAPARAILDSVRTQAGLTFAIEFSRQTGKNELSAQLELALLTAGQALGLGPVANIKTAPTLDPQVKISLRRLQAALRAARVPFRTSAGNAVDVGGARQTFLSAQTEANVVGDTATHLLECDEAQDTDPDKFDRDFRPMAAANNATTVFYGTAWADDSLLERELTRARELERDDGIRRAFVVPWTSAAPHIPAYRAYVESERDRLGPTNPLFTTQYELTPLAGEGRLLSEQHVAQLRGTFPRRTTPPPVGTTVAGLDIGGGNASAADPDRTVLTLGTTVPGSPDEPIAANHGALLHHLAWSGVPTDQLVPQLVDILRTWRVSTVVVDATGLGEPVAAILSRSLGARRVLPVKFTRPTKSQLGFDLIGSAATGHLKLHADDGQPDTDTLWSELRLAKREVYPSKAINFYVDEHDGHDDYLVSVALFNHAVRNTTARIARGR